MLRLMATGAVFVVCATASAQAVLMLDHARQAQDAHAADAVSPVSAVAAQQAALAAPAQGLTASLAKGADGHYWADGAVNGHNVHFLVDTGATAVTLTADDALRLGLTPQTLNYDLKMSTANGESRAARVKLSSISVAGAQVDNVDAVVVENGLQTSLLGMTYLGRLTRIEATQTTMILQP